MYRTHCVLVLLSLYAAMAYSFTWEIVTSATRRNQLDFYDIDGTLTHTETLTSPSDTINYIIYDPVHDRVLYAYATSIYSFEIATKKKECLIRAYTNTTISSLAYDPATELLFWFESSKNLYSMSLKPRLNKNKIKKKQLILNEVWIYQITVDSCGGFLYYSQIVEPSIFQIVRARLDGTQSEVEGVHYGSIFAMFSNPDQKSPKLYWNEYTGTSKEIFKYSDLHGENITTIHKLISRNLFTYCLTASKEIIYLQINNGIWKISKNLPHDIDIESQPFIENDENFTGIATKYSIEDMTRGHQDCDALKSLLPNNSVSTDVSQLCVHGTKSSGESRCECTQGYGGERCDYKISECHNYCFQGDCSVSVEGQPKCRCNSGYSGVRCEMNVCQAYCLNDGVCSLCEDRKPVCQCTGGYDGDRCEVPVFITKCVQTASMLRDFLNTDIPSVKGVKSTCASTVF